jgi:orotidine-5'-phosphate decarboxylase
MTRNPIIVALDLESAGQARDLVQRLGGCVNFYKIGMELYAGAGVAFVRELVDQGKEVFLDLKFYDIPETVRRATAQVAKTGVRFLTVHAVPSVVRAAVEGRGDAGGLQLLAVTVLTSFGPEDLADLDTRQTIPELVERRAKSSVSLGVDGLVCSPLEAAKLRESLGKKPILVTPGVRSAGADQGDQKRVATPAAAMRDGADYLVIGRQITRAKDPAGEAGRILEEIGAAWLSA